MSTKGIQMGGLHVAACANHKSANADGDDVLMSMVAMVAAVQIVVVMRVVIVVLVILLMVMVIMVMMMMNMHYRRRRRCSHVRWSPPDVVGNEGRP